MSTFPTGTGDAVAARARTHLKVFTDWLTANGQQGKGLVGEVGWPGSSNPGTDPIPGSGTGAKFDPRWDATAQQWFLDANLHNLHVTNWVTSEWNIDLRAYRTDDGNNKALNYRTTVSSVLEQNLSAGSYLRGVNYAGAEYSDQGPNGVLNMSTTAQPGAGYYYPTPAGYGVLKTRGVDLVRFAIRWERLQRTLKGPLDTNELNMLIATVNAARLAGQVVLIDMHNYGRYDTIATGTSGGVFDIGQNAPATHRGAAVGGTMMECFNDFWGKVADVFKNDAGIWGYGLTNEPHGLTGNVATWKEASRQACEVIRLRTQTQKVVIGGYFYSTIPGWLDQNGATAWMTQTIPAGQSLAGQPRNNDPHIIWEGHHYWDTNHNGGFEDSYDQEITNCTNSGFTSYSNAGYVAPSTGNTLQTGDRIIFQSGMDAINEWTVSPTLNTTGTNTVTIPYAAEGNPGNSLRIQATATSDEGGVRKSLTTAQGQNIRSASFDFKLPTGAVMPAGAFTIFHAWGNAYSPDLIEIRVQSSGAGYKVGLTIPSGSYTFVPGTEVLTKGAWHNIKLVVSDANYKIFLNGSVTADVTLAASLTGINIGGIALGKFYGNYVGDMLYDNFIGGIPASFWAPPDGGKLTAAVIPPSPGTNKSGLLGFF